MSTIGVEYVGKNRRELSRTRARRDVGLFDVVLLVIIVAIPTLIIAEIGIVMEMMAR